MRWQHQGNGVALRRETPCSPRGASRVPVGTLGFAREREPLEAPSGAAV